MEGNGQRFGDDGGAVSESIAALAHGYCDEIEEAVSNVDVDGVVDTTVVVLIRCETVSRDQGALSASTENPSKVIGLLLTVAERIVSSLDDEALGGEGE